MRAPKPAKEQRGQGLVEYVLILSLVALAVIAVLVVFGPALGRTFQSITESFGQPVSTASSSASASPEAVITFGPSVLTEVPTETPVPSSTLAPSDTPTATTTLVSSDTPAPTSTLVPSDTPAPTSTTAPSSTTVQGAPTSTPAPTNTSVPTSTPAPTNTSVPVSTPIPTNTNVPSSTPVPTNTTVPTSTRPPATAGPTPITGVIVSASAARTGGGSGNALDVTVTVSGSATLTLVDSVSGTLASNQACSGTCVIHIGSIGRNAGYIAITAAAGGVFTVWYPAKP